MRNKKLYFTLLSGNVFEGGMSRNNAFATYISNNDFYQLNFYTNNIFIRVLNVIIFLFYLIFIKKRIIFIHLGVFTYLTPPKLFSSYLRKLFRILISNFDKNNELIIEINDLPYEQSIDLNLEVNLVFKNFQEDIFRLKNAKFIFASVLMRDYALNNYMVNHNFTTVITNGSPKIKTLDKNNLRSKLQNLKGLKIIYAGTLNKGRQILDIISLFENIGTVNLILIGSNGEWINDLNLKENIYYLGNFQEEHAHFLVSLCDLGLLPYDENRLYYNICYPTKVPFYLSAGIPILSTPLDELQASHINGVYFKSFSQWNVFFSNLSIDKINIYKKDINPNDFLWETIFQNSKIYKLW